LVFAEPAFATVYIEWDNNSVTFLYFSNFIASLLYNTSEFMPKRLAWFHTLEVAMKQMKI
jgi:hypothetical protein